MTILFAASEEEAFVTTGTITSTTSTTFFDNTMADGALVLRDTSFVTTAITASSEIWIHSTSYIGVGGNGDGDNYLISSGATPILRVTQIFPNNRLDFQYWDGAAWVDIATNISIAALFKWDIHCKIDATEGEFSIYQDGVLLASFSGDTTQSGASTADTVKFGGCSNGVIHYLSEAIIKTTPTLGNQLQTLALTGDGLFTQFSGTFADIDESLLNDDGTLVTGAANNDQSSYTMGASTTPANAVISALVVSTRSSRGSTGPQNMQLTSVVNSTSYPSASVSGIDLSLRPFQSIITLNPDTGLTWDDTAIAATEIGLKAIT